MVETVIAVSRFSTSMNTCFSEEILAIDIFYLFPGAKTVIAKQLFIWCFYLNDSENVENDLFYRINYSNSLILNILQKKYL